MFSVIPWVVLLLCCVAALIRVLYLVVRRMTKRDGVRARLWRGLLALGICFALTIGWMGGTQRLAGTPAIRGADDRPVAGSIAELRRVTVNGRREWISVRGHDRTAPVLLFLAGGPGGTQMAAVRHELGDLERHFVVVNWDQPGSGKSYGAMPIRDIAVQTYIDDGIALTELLLTEFGQEQLYLMGESWGSALGLLLADARPDLYRAFIGTGQMVAFEETERIDYQLAMDMATAEGNARLARRLEGNGPPPYYGADVTWKSNAYLSDLGQRMAANPRIENGGYRTLRDICSEEYGLFDKINFLRGIVDTFGHVYPQLYAVDLREACPRVGIPVYFFLGRHDLNAPPSLAESYMQKLDAPEKGIVWFEHSGHSPWINEPDAFVRNTLDVFLGR